MADIDSQVSIGRIDLVDEPEFELGGMRVCPAERAVIMNGDRRELQPRVMQVLVALAQARPAVVSRDRLIERCWEGRVVGDDALNRVILALRHLAQAFTAQPFAIETVPRVGHRLVENRMHADAASPLRSKWWRLLAVAVALLILVAGALLVWHQRSAAPAPASIAVMPFRNLGDGDPYFAEGIGEEIFGQLAREPQFRVAGSSSASQAARNSDVQDVARRLRVDYVVEGTVRRQGDSVRVAAHLVRASDGTRLWSDSYDGTLDDIFTIQRQIGTAIAGALRRKLVRAPAVSGQLVTDGNAYNLYLTARGLLRTRNRRAGPTAADLLRDAIQMDAGYAPAWASLAEATALAGALQDKEVFARSVAQAQGYARHALKLAPDLAEAHRALGGLLGFGTPEALAHLHRAAELEPNRAENMLGLGTAYGAAGEFQKELAAYRRALELDPLWFRAAGAYSAALAEMGQRPQAERIATRGFAADDIQRHILLGKIAAATGDLSEATQHWSIVAASNSRRWSDTARRNRDQHLFALGLGGGPATIPRPLDQRHSERVWLSAPPQAAVWKARNRSAVAAAVYRDDNHVAAKLMLNEGRQGEIAAAYGAPGGAIGIRRGVPLRADQLSEAPVVALALRSAGASAEADRLLSQAEKLIQAVYDRGPVPFWFHADAAAALAVRGRKDEALTRLDRAIDRGWRHSGSTDLRDIAEEPAFRSLRGDARFERSRARLLAHYARERDETRAILLKLRA